MSKQRKYPTYAVPKGEFTIVVRDAATGEIKRIQKEPNIVTMRAFARYGQQIAPLNVSTQRMGISPRIHGRQVSREEITPAAIGNNITSPPTFSNIRLTEETMSTPAFSEIVQRFDVPPVNRTIFTIILGSTGDVNFLGNTYGEPIAYANLVTPCTQSTTEILDIFYRVQLLESPVDPLVEHPSHPSQPIALASKFVNEDGPNALTVSSWFAPSYDFNTFVQSFPQQRIFSWAPGFPLPGDFKIYTTNWMDQTNSFVPALTNNSTVQGFTGNDPNAGGTTRFGQYYLVIREAANPSPTNVGQIIKNVWFGRGRNASGTSPDINSARVVSTHIVPAVPDNFTKVQPLHNHSALAVAPFLDPSFLASGTGSIRLNADDWTNYSLPEYYRIDIGTSGNIPTSKYSFRQRYITGYVGNSYLALALATSGTIIRNGEQGLVWENDHHGLKHFLNNGSGSYNGTINRNGRAYYSPSNPQYEPDVTVLSYDLTGVSLGDVKAVRFYDFDLLTSPSLGVSSIRQVAVDKNGSIWVACGNTGLWRIDNPKGVATVTHIVNPITLAVSYPCYGVSIGKLVLGNDTIVAVFKGGVGNVPEGGIALSTDYGVTWPTVYNTASVPAFTFTGITDNNWANVYKIHVDKSTADYKLGVVQSSDGGVTGQLVWWSQTYPAKAGPTIPNMSSSVTDVENFTCWYENTVRVSDTNSLWSIERLVSGTERPNFTRFYTTRLFDNSSNFSSNCQNGSTGTTNGFTGGALTFMYDYYGNPFVAGHTESVIVNADGTQILTLYSPNNGSNSSQQNIVMMNNNTYLTQTFGNTSNSQSGVTLTSRSPNLAITDPGLSVSVLNGRYRCTEEMVWNKYHWNGAAWQQNYYNTAIDSSLNTYSGTRHNFDTESYTFTGRSTIVVGDAASPRVATAGNWAAGTMTFACRMTREAKLTGQTAGAEVFTGFDKSRQYYITGVTTGLAGSWRISGNFTAFFTAGTKFVTDQNTFAGSNQVVWTVGLAGSTYSGITNETTIPVGAAETINASSTGAGYIYASIFEFYVSNPAATSQTGIQQGASFKQFGVNAAATVSTPTNVLLTVTGTTATLYHNGVSVGSASMDYPLRWDNPSTQLEIVVGGRGRITDNAGFTTTEQFFRGTLLNVIFSNIVWSAPQIAAHNASPLADPTTYGTPVPAVNIIARYQLNQALNETKATHTTFDDLLNGTDIRFIAGGSGTDFISTDYYTIGVVDGILKDNATQYNYRSKYFIMPVENGIDTFTPVTVPGVGSTITERVCWRLTNAGGSTNDFFFYPGPVGECTAIGNKTAFSSGQYALAYQNSGGQITYSWKMEGFVTNVSGFTTPTTTGPDTSAMHMNFYLATNYSNTGATVPNPSYFVMFRGDGTIQAFRITSSFEGVITESSGALGTWAPGDTFGLVRTAGNVIEVRSGPSLATLLYTFPTTNSQTMFPGIYQSNPARFSGYDAVVTYPRAAYFADVGSDNVSPALRTGKFHTLFYNFDATIPRTSVAVSVDQANIGAVDSFNNKFTVTGVDVTATFTAGSIIKVVNNTDPDTEGQVFTILTSTFTLGNTEIVVGDTPISGVYPTYIQVIPPTATPTGQLWKLLSVIIPGVTVGTVSAPFTIDSTHIGALPAPGVNEVVFVPENGNLLFNAAQVGKTIAGMFTVLYKEPL